MIQSTTKTFGDLAFTTSTFPARRAFKLLARLLKLAGPAIGGLKGVSLQTDLEDVLPAIGAALSDLDADGVSALALELLSMTQVNMAGTSVDFAREEAVDLVFSGRLRTYVDVLLWVVRWNFQDFLKGAVAAPSALAPAT